MFWGSTASGSAYYLFGTGTQIYYNGVLSASYSSTALNGSTPYDDLTLVIYFSMNHSAIYYE